MSATGETRPEALKALSQQLCGDVDIAIDAHGQWFHEGSPIGRIGLVKLFASVLRREEDGDYWLVTPVERARIRVADAPFTAVAVWRDDAGVVWFRTNLDDETPLDAAHPLRMAEGAVAGEPRPYVHVRRGLEARLLRPVFYALVEMAEERDGALVVASGGAEFPLGAIE